MSLSKQLTLFIGLMALGTTSAWAACTRLSQPTVNLDMVVGRVVVPPDLPVGSVIVSRDWTMNAPGASYSCTAGTNRFAAKIVRQGPRTWEIKSIPPTCRVSACVSAAAARRSISSIPTFFPRQPDHQLFAGRVALYAGDY
jgi:hypothetical protein